MGVVVVAVAPFPCGNSRRVLIVAFQYRTCFSRNGENAEWGACTVRRYEVCRLRCHVISRSTQLQPFVAYCADALLCLRGHRVEGVWALGFDDSIHLVYTVL